MYLEACDKVFIVTSFNLLNGTDIECATEFERF